MTDPDLKWFVELTDADFADASVDPEVIIERKINKTIEENIAQLLSKAIGYAISEGVADMVNLEDHLD